MSDQTWAIVLAGGEGTRIQPLIERCLGFACPKQYFTFCGTRSMLEHTIDRAVELVGPDRVLTVIGSGHRRFLETQRIQGEVIEQPLPRGTGAGVFLPAAHILAQNPDATVLIFPSDHFVCPKAHFLKQVDQVRASMDRLPDRLLLMGAVPDLPEADYGWVEPGRRLGLLDGSASSGIHEVASFREKPSPEEASKYFERGHLWNTMIVATKIRTLWSLGRRLIPQATAKFEWFLRKLGPGREKMKREADSSVVTLYNSIPTFDFSSSILTRGTSQLAVVPLEGIMWSDWGRPERVFESLRKIGRRPSLLETARRWQRQSGLSGPSVDTGFVRFESSVLR